MEKFAIIYHSEMTDITLYFICKNKQVLIDSGILINKFINFETYENYIMLKKDLDDRQIQFINSENVENENDIKNLIVVQKYSYRF